MDNAAVIDVFSFSPLISLRGRRREALKCFSSWCVNGWGGSFVVKNQGLKSTQVSPFFFWYGGSFRAQQVSGVNLVLNRVHELEIYALK